MDSSPYFFHTSMETSGGTPKAERNTISSLTPYMRLYSSLISFAFSRVMPFIWESRPGSFSITSRAFIPKVSIMRPARARPTPFTAPEDRYRSIPSSVTGRACSKTSARNWRP